MAPKPQARDKLELFRSHFDQLLDPSHELILLANQIDWPTLDAAFVDTYCPDNGAVPPENSIRAWYRDMARS